MMDSNRKRRGQQGFTMIELLLVMVILGMLAALVGPNLIGQAGKARSKTARVQIANLGTALDTYALDVGRYPSGAEGLQGLMDRPSGLAMWDGPYLAKKVPMDPWGNEYQYQEPSSGGLYTITSYGSDGRAGGDGDAVDITNFD
jgi:general secretion pathway protein G